MGQWRVQFRERMVYIWHGENLTGAVWDDTNSRLTIADAIELARAIPSLPWKDMLEVWSPLPNADLHEQRIYGKTLTPGTRSYD